MPLGSDICQHYVIWRFWHGCFTVKEFCPQNIHQNITKFPSSHYRLTKAFSCSEYLSNTTLTFPLILPPISRWEKSKVTFHNKRSLRKKKKKKFKDIYYIAFFNVIFYGYNDFLFQLVNWKGNFIGICRFHLCYLNIYQIFEPK